MQVRQTRHRRHSLFAAILVLASTGACNFLGERSVDPDDSSREHEESTHCELVDGRTIGTVSDGLDVAGPDLAVDSDGVPRVAWAVEQSSGPIHLAHRDADGWSTTSSDRFRFEPNLRDLSSLDLTVADGVPIVAAYSANYRGDVHRALTLFTVSDGSWEPFGEFGADHHLESPLRTDTRGRLHLLTDVTRRDAEGDEDGHRLQYSWGRPEDLEHRKLYEKHNHTVDPSTLGKSAGDVRAVFRDPSRDWGYYSLRSGASEPERLEGLEEVESLEESTAVAVDGTGTVHLLGRTDDRGYAVFRRQSDGSWETIPVADEFNSNWRDECRDDDATLSELDGTTCQVDHTSYSMAGPGKRLFERGDDIWIATTRVRTTGTATWHCDEDYIGCTGPCNLDRNVDTEKTVVMGPIRDGTVALREVDGLRPSQLWTSTRFGPDGHLHLAFVRDTDDESAQEIRYGRVRCH